MVINNFSIASRAYFQQEEEADIEVEEEENMAHPKEAVQSLEGGRLMSTTRFYSCRLVAPQIAEVCRTAAILS